MRFGDSHSLDLCTDQISVYERHGTSEINSGNNSTNVATSYVMQANLHQGDDVFSDMARGRFCLCAAFKENMAWNYVVNLLHMTWTIYYLKVVDSIKK